MCRQTAAGLSLSSFFFYLTAFQIEIDGKNCSMSSSKNTDTFSGQEPPSPAVPVVAPLCSPCSSSYFFFPVILFDSFILFYFLSFSSKKQMMSVSVGLVFPRDLNGQCQAATHTNRGHISGRGVWLLSFGPLFILSLGSDVVVGIVGTVEMCAFVLTAVHHFE
jgi:hypothetical protein